VVLGNVAVRHPHTRVRHVEEDVDRLAGADEDGVLPDEIRLGDAVSARREATSFKAVAAKAVLRREVTRYSFPPVTLLTSDTNVCFSTPDTAV
jgi:hypothetical protein